MSFLISGLTHHFDCQSASGPTDLTRHVGVIYPPSSLSFDTWQTEQGRTGTQEECECTRNAADDGVVKGL